MNREPELELAVDQLTTLLNSQIGLRPEPTLRGRLRRCIRDESTAAGQDSLTYVSSLTDKDALQRLVNRVTVQETSFFRHPEHFDVLAHQILPTLTQPVRIWSAGCANGQEAYSIAMVLEEQGVAGSVIATDLSTAALHRTATAEYSTRELRGLSATRLARHGIRSGDSWQINDALRNRVSTMRHNLVDPLSEPVRACQVVFCRNVLIYLSAEHTRTMLGWVADALPENGCLFLGSAEAMWPLSDRFETVRVGDTFIYRPRPEHVAPSKPDKAIARSRRARVRRRVGPGQLAHPTGASAPRRVPPAGQPAPALAIAESAEQLARTGQQALDAHESAPAITAFRKWAYLMPENAMAHLHLGLAFEAAGDQSSARRAFTAARRAVLDEDPDRAAHSIDGYAPAELLRLLDAKTQGPAR